jgi:hypothetical protein
MTFRNERERTVYHAALEQMRNMPSEKAEAEARHALELERMLITNRRGGTGDNGRALAGQPCGPAGRLIRGDVDAIVAGLMREACEFFGPLPAEQGYIKRSHKTAPWRWYTMTALRRAFGPARAAMALRMTDAGVRTGEFRLHEMNLAAYAAALKTGERLEREQGSEAAT